MKLQLLERAYTGLDSDTLRTYRDLFAGGVQFRRSVSRYLPKNDVEPDELYLRRCRHAHYLNYTAPIANYLTSWLFTAPPTLTLRGGDAPDEWYLRWKDNVDDRGTDLDDFLRQRFLEALVARRAYWLLEWPEPNEAIDSLEEYRTAGMDVAHLCPVLAEQVTQWRRDDDGQLQWALVRRETRQLLNLTDEYETVTITWTLYDRTGDHRRWQLAYGAGRPLPKSTEVYEIDPPMVPAGVFPLIEMELPSHLWLLDQIADSQLESFRTRNAQSWALYRTCYTMPVLKLKDAKKLPTMGAGYALTIGIDESIEWPSPPSTPYDALGNYAQTIKDELYRVVHQMAAGVDNNAAAIGRSGESKQADAEATRVVLGAYGSFVREATVRTMQALAAGRSDAVDWQIGGMDRFELDDATALTETAVQNELLKIPSPTYRRELLTRIAVASLRDADESTKATIRAEIRDGLAAEYDAMQPVLAAVDDTTTDTAQASADGAPPSSPAQPRSQTLPSTERRATRTST